MTFRFTAVSLALLFAASAQAQPIYRCETGQGKVEFSDAPCARGAAGAAVTVRPNTLDAAESREATLRAENERLREQLAAPAPAPAAGRSPAEVRADLADSAACKRARREHEVSASSVKPNKAQLEALASSMRAACGMREPDRIVNKTTVVNVDAPARPVAPARRPAGQ
ncbi:DUF4124 domain-containing protein [Piscinibacter sp.]|uniref:DUF4124 domain-containing protein n=1 Tax=Piscinibacter sp. TaxID=1903157 RepID=UPI0039E386DD